MPGPRILDGKTLAARIRQDVAARVSALGFVPGLHVIRVGDDPASQVYVRNKARACAEAGIRSTEHHLEPGIAAGDLLDLIRDLGRDPEADGILVQFPLPAPLDATAVIDAIDPARDVDGLHPLNLGLLAAGRPGLVPCTATGVMRLLDEAGIGLAGRRVAVVGRSLLVGRPLSLLLLHRHATVTMCHSRTLDLDARVRDAEILVAAAGRPGLVRGEWIREGAVVIDVGINRTPDGRLVGDVDFDAAADRAGAITPVPGGVGPLTVACLLRNTLDAATRRRGIDR
jgi:methylenetetrahydrofolate dehydrogenase (NADP+)/methenyltetrahydrofolate cyclohydrolase